MKETRTFIKKYLLYARSFKPELTEEAFSLIKSFYINMGITGVDGLPRRLDSLIGITISIAKLKLKDVADVEDAQEAMMIYNDTLKAFNQAILSYSNPRDIAYEQIRNVIKENNGSAISLVNAAIKAAQQNKDVKYYLKINEGNDNNNNRDALKSNENHHFREVLKLLRNDKSIQVVQEKPTILRWKDENNLTIDKAKETFALHSKEDNYSLEKQVQKDSKPISIAPLCDGCDECEGIQKNNILQTNLDSSDISLFTIDGKQDNSCPIKTNNSNAFFSYNQINTIENTTTIVKEDNTRKDIEGNTKLQKNEKLKPPSHSLHSSHSDIRIVDNETNNNQIKIDSNNVEQQQHIQLKHSPFADIYTDKINVELEDPRSYVKFSK